MKRHSYQTDDAGFSMAELLIVISIIGIISAIAIPRYLEQKDRAILIATIANLNAMRTGLSQYAANSNDNLYPVEPMDYRAFILMVPECNMPPIDSDAKIATVSFAYSGNGSTYAIRAISTDRSATKLITTPAGTIYN